MWVFGYGSLVWRPDFPFLDRRPAFIWGWTRRFWQGSTDHRGHPEAPGRVVTLLPAPRDTANVPCWGMAYSLALECADEVVEHLDYRERGGYARHNVELHFATRSTGTPQNGTVYIATPDNASYLGPADPEQIAAQIVRAHGPSGANLEYLVELAESLRRMGAVDPHVFDLERRALSISEENAPHDQLLGPLSTSKPGGLAGPKPAAKPR